MLQRGEIEITVQLAPVEMRMILALMLNRGRFLSVDDLVECVWPDDDGGPLDAKGRIASIVGRMRRRGIDIENDGWRGYRIA